MLDQLPYHITLSILKFLPNIVDETDVNPFGVYGIFKRDPTRQIERIFNFHNSGHVEEYDEGTPTLEHVLSVCLSKSESYTLNIMDASTYTKKTVKNVIKAASPNIRNMRLKIDAKHVGEYLDMLPVNGKILLGVEDFEFEQFYTEQQRQDIIQLMTTTSLIQEIAVKISGSPSDRLYKILLNVLLKDNHSKLDISVNIYTITNAQTILLDSNFWKVIGPHVTNINCRDEPDNLLMFQVCKLVFDSVLCAAQQKESKLQRTVTLHELFLSFVCRQGSTWTNRITNKRLKIIRIFHSAGQYGLEFVRHLVHNNNVQEVSFSAASSIRFKDVLFHNLTVVRKDQKWEIVHYYLFCFNNPDAEQFLKIVSARNLRTEEERAEIVRELQCYLNEPPTGNGEE